LAADLVLCIITHFLQNEKNEFFPHRSVL
jgi:hypothetical protein